MLKYNNFDFVQNQQEFKFQFIKIHKCVCPMTYFFFGN